MSALSLPGVDTLPARSVRPIALSQWFTPEWLAKRVVASCGVKHRSGRVLEPSAGDGALVKALREDFAASIDAIDIDPSLCAKRGWECADYMTRPAPAERYSLAVMNPPYEDDLDSRFIAKAMNECDALIAVVRAVFFNGIGRHARVWSRVESDEWRVQSIAYLVRRPSFLLAGVEQGGAQADFVVIKMARGYTGDARVEWWQ